jgi:hypothetical protein
VEGDYEGDFINDKKEGKGDFVNGFGDIYGKTKNLLVIIIFNVILRCV